MADMWAWSPIKGGTADKPVEVDFGAKVTKAQLGVDDADWDAMVEAGSVRPYAPPKMPDTYQSSPVEFLKEQAAKAENDEDLALSANLGGSYFGPPAEEVLSTGAGKTEQ